MVMRYLQGFSSVGRASVSKTEGRGFESLSPCHFNCLKNLIFEEVMINPFKYVQQVRNEVSKIVWPTRKETLITTAMVFVMVLIFSLFFLLVDNIISWFIRLILGI